MTDREEAARKEGLVNLGLLDMYPADMPIEEVIASLRRQFGRFQGAFVKKVKVRDMTSFEYDVAKGELLMKAHPSYRGPGPSTIHETAKMLHGEYQAAKAEMLRAAHR